MEDILIVIFSVLGLIVLLAIIFALPLMLLWNWLMPEIFGLREIGFWQALGLGFLSGILFRTGSSSSKN